MSAFIVMLICVEQALWEQNIAVCYLLWCYVKRIRFALVTFPETRLDSNKEVTCAGYPSIFMIVCIEQTLWGRNLHIITSFSIYMNLISFWCRGFPETRLGVLEQG